MDDIRNPRARTSAQLSCKVGPKMNLAKVPDGGCDWLAASRVFAAMVELILKPPQKECNCICGAQVYIVCICVVFLFDHVCTCCCWFYKRTAVGLITVQDIHPIKLVESFALI